MGIKMDNITANQCRILTDKAREVQIPVIINNILQDNKIRAENGYSHAFYDLEHHLQDDVVKILESEPYNFTVVTFKREIQVSW